MASATQPLGIIQALSGIGKCKTTMGKVPLSDSEESGMAQVPTDRGSARPRCGREAHVIGAGITVLASMTEAAIRAAALRPRSTLLASSLAAAARLSFRCTYFFTATS